MNQRKPIDTEKLNLLAAQLKLWLLDVLLWLSAWMGRALPRACRIMLREDIRHALQGARIVVFMLALSRCGVAPAMPPQRPHAPPRGFRRTQFLASDLRNICRTVKLRGRTSAARLAELRDVLDNLDAWAARVRRRLMAPPHDGQLVLCFAIGDRLRARVTPAPAFADSS